MSGTILFRFFLVWYTVGVILLTFDILPTWLEWANVVFLVVAGTIGVVYFCSSYGVKRGMIASLVIFVVSMFAEYLGTTYGLIFGKYIYSTDFGILLAGVPMTIGFAWLLVMSTTHALLQRIQLPHPLLSVLYGGLMAVVFDLALDPVAYVVKEYWIWQETGWYYGIPLQNFLGWFFVAAVLHSFLLRFLPATSKRNEGWHHRAVLLFPLLVSMFLLIALVEGLYLAACITFLGSAVILLHYYLHWRRASA